MTPRLALLVLPCVAVLGLAPAASAAEGSAADHSAHAGHGDHSAHDAHAGHQGHAQHEEPLAGDTPLPDRSVYQLAGDWTDAEGRVAPLARLRGTSVFATMFYGTCTAICPKAVEDMKRLEAALPDADRARARFLLVTLDPERDTPEQLLAFAREKELDLGRWTLLQGSPDQVKEVAAVLGVRYRARGDGEFSHTARITLLDPEGVVVAHADGLERPVDELVGAFTGQKAAKGAD